MLFSGCPDTCSLFFLSACALVPNKEQKNVGSLSKGENSCQNVPALTSVLISHVQSCYATAYQWNSVLMQSFYILCWWKNCLFYLLFII